MCITILIEGSIAVGKSLFLSTMEGTNCSLAAKSMIIREPIDLWTNLSGINLLELYNNDQKLWGFAFESYIFLTMIKSHKAPLDKNKVYRVMERSLFSAMNVFTKNLKIDNKLEPISYDILHEWYTFLTSSELKDKKFLILYLSAPPEVLLQRIINRNRKEEKNTTLNYLQNLDNLYEKWISNEVLKGTEIVVINTNKPEADTIVEFKDLLRKLEIFL